MGGVLRGFAVAVEVDGAEVVDGSLQAFFEFDGGFPT